MKYCSKEDIYLFRTGNARQAYRNFGCHYIEAEDAYRFCVWAPNAAAVSVVGEFNDWKPKADPMKEIETGIYEAVIPDAKEGMCYKYCIQTKKGELLYKADPYAFYAELRPDTASRIWRLDGYRWRDKVFLSKRGKMNSVNVPMSIYEMHLGSWRGKKEEDETYPNFREIADWLVPYVQEMGFTHVELMPVTEYPLDMSWGYQVTGYYAVSSRYGTPQDFMYLVDKLHRAGIGVILDWVPAHFPKDAHGLIRFDGECCYEHADPRKGEMPQWGTLTYNYGRPEVQSFLISSAAFFADVYHIDGIRLDAVSAMLYLDFGKQQGEWVPNEEGHNINFEAVEFMRNLNQALHETFPGFITIAEESTAYPRVTHPIEEDGLGFSYKWNMGYMHDTLYYIGLDPIHRKFHHSAMTFSMEYAFSENYILPYSHDEVVHGKASMVNKICGDYEQKFSTLKTLYGYMFAHPGKKLLFMGDEFAQFIEWDYKKELDWNLPEEYDSHRGVKNFMAGLNRFYREHPAFYQIEDSWDGFEWMNVEDEEYSVFAFVRRSKKRKEQIVCVFNFTPVERIKYQLQAPGPGSLTEIFSSDQAEFSGAGRKNRKKKIRKRKKTDRKFGETDRDYIAEVDIPPLSVIYFLYEEAETSSTRKRNKIDQK